VLSELGRVNEAIRTLDTALVSAPRDADVLLALGILHRNTGDTASATRYARMLVQSYPDDPRGQALLKSLTR
jgi:Flp pilus assembly protein TadD